MKTYATRSNAIKAAARILAYEYYHGKVERQIIALEDGRFGILFFASDASDATYIANFAPVTHGSLPICYQRAA